MIRKPVVAGQFYPQDKRELEKTIEDLFARVQDKTPKNRVKGLVLPHAGYIYSGAVAAQTIDSVELKKLFVILGPNHTGQGEHFSVMAEGRWQMPMGDVPIDEALASKILEGSMHLKKDSLAHRFEHSIEVEIPLLQFLKREFTFVPIVVDRSTKDIYSSIASDIVRAIRSSGRMDDTLIIASTDMTHFEPQKSAQEKDLYAIDAILNLDTDSLLKRVADKNISMCGVAPVAITIEIAKQLGATKGTLVKYQTSGDVNKDYSSVVGYAGIRLN